MYIVGCSGSFSLGSSAFFFHWYNFFCNNLLKKLSMIIDNILINNLRAVSFLYLLNVLFLHWSKYFFNIFLLTICFIFIIFNNKWFFLNSDNLSLNASNGYLCVLLNTYLFNISHARSLSNNSLFNFLYISFVSTCLFKSSSSFSLIIILYFSIIFIYSSISFSSFSFSLFICLFLSFSSIISLSIFLYFSISNCLSFSRSIDLNLSSSLSLSRFSFSLFSLSSNNFLSSSLCNCITFLKYLVKYFLKIFLFCLSLIHFIRCKNILAFINNISFCFFFSFSFNKFSNLSISSFLLISSVFIVIVFIFVTDLDSGCPFNSISSINSFSTFKGNSFILFLMYFKVIWIYL